jgi:hypothetical protein
MRFLLFIIRLNAILMLAFGIAFALYGPLMMAFFTIPELKINSDIYWQIAAFARMFGAALFGYGLLLWALRDAIGHLPILNQRSIIASLILANLMGAFVAITQTSSIWGTAAGWITTGMFVIFLLAYIYAITQIHSDRPVENSPYP